MRVIANPGRFCAIEGLVELAGDVVLVDGRPLAEIIRGYYVEELTNPDFAGTSLLQIEPAHLHRSPCGPSSERP